MADVSDQKGLEMVNSVKRVSRETEERLTIFNALLQRWQKRINLIAPSTINSIWERHIVDSMQTVNQMGDARSVVDIGSGAGFPGIIIACILAEHGEGKIAFVESVGKKCQFIKTAVREMGLQKSGVQIDVYNERIEAVMPELIQHDLISARALAPLDALLEMTSGQLAGGAVGLFPKGKDHAAEIARAREKFDFDVDITPSMLEENSVLLKITNLRDR